MTTTNPINLQRRAARIVCELRLRTNETLEFILDQTANHFELKKEDIISRKRTEKIAFARHCFFALARAQGFTFEVMGHFLDKRDHGTAIRGVQQTRDLCEVHPLLNQHFEELKAIVEEGLK